METSHQKPQANTARTNNQRNPPHFSRIALFIWEFESNVCLKSKRKANFTKNSGQNHERTEITIMNCKKI
ncbi:hypothetical protein YBT1518_33427 (plasmid) [Bacillus thuringiensis YBT-1518]|uniref:Uncharacterized protein n=1 Tax=Bacillus thuringiensis YBT-1518 TaxID=529122 RepID=A0A9W3KJC4_BACTU|nr:hypothetical protein YBT1518_33427 [Bacillus thuringiensis YBT-1518]